MDAQTFLDNFATIAEAPGGVQRLRGMVRQLAVTGRLAALPEPAGRRDDGPFEIPSHWIWSSMQELHTKLGSGSTPRGGKNAYVPRGVAFIRSQNVWNDGLRLSGVARIPEETHAQMAGTAVRPGDVLLNITGASIGRACVVPDDFDEDANVSQHVAILRLLDPRRRRWVHLFMVSPAGFEAVMSDQVGISREGLSMRRLRGFSVPVPPLEEQDRIVAKVDELMGLCDDLEAHQERRHRASARFRSSSLHALTEAESTENFRLAWQRVESNWPAITAASDSIGELRQTILQLAFEGRLTGAGAHGRPRSESTPPILDGPFPIPGHWRWARFDEVVDSRLGKMLDKAKNTGPLRPYLRNANVQWFRFDLSDVHELRLEDADLETHSLRAGDLVICEGGEPGRLAVCDDAVSGMVFQKALHRARPRGEVDVWYLAYLLRCHAGSGYLSTFFTGATIKHLTGKALGTVPVPVPPIEEQRQIVARIEELTAACAQLEANTSRCAAIQAAAAAGLTRAT